jgi:tetratricopeptide (TPR) repeat protein
MDPDQCPLKPASLSLLWDFQDPKSSEQRFIRLRDRAASSGDLLLAALASTQHARTLGLQRRFDEGNAVLQMIEIQYPNPIGELGVRIALERGRLLNSSGSKDQSKPHFERAWTMACESGLDGLAVDAAHMLGIVHESDHAMEWNQRALDLAMRSDQSDARKWRGSLLNNMGWTLHASGDYEHALQLFEQALNERIENGTPTTIRIARWCVGRCLRSLDRIDDALTIQRELESDPDADGYVHEEIAECLHTLGKGDEAQPYFARAFEMLSKADWLCDQDPDRIKRLQDLGGKGA